MPTIYWNQTYSLGNETVDAQHCRLLELAEMLRVALQAGRVEPVIDEALEALKHYARDHFAAEEALFAAVGARLREQHCRSHRTLLVELDELFLDRELGHTALAAKLVDWVSNRLVAHFLYEDSNSWASRADGAA